MHVNIETERLKIRPLILEDADFILELLNTKGWIQYIGDRNVRDIQAAKEYIQRILSNDQFYYNVYETKDTKTPIGIVTFLFREEQNYPDIGFAMLSQFEKNGYAFEATKTYLDQIRKNRTDNIIAIIRADNLKSINLIEKLGLHFEKSYMEQDETLNIYSLY